MLLLKSNQPKFRAVRYSVKCWKESNMVRLFDEIRTLFERNWRCALQAKLNARAGKKEGGWSVTPLGIFTRHRFPIPIFPAAAEFRFSLCEMRRQEPA